MISALRLWRYNEVTGAWVYERSAEPDTADAWLREYQKADPTAHFKIARSRPTNNPLGCFFCESKGRHRPHCPRRAA